MSVPSTQAQASHEERQSARAEADEQRFFDHRDDLARAVKAAQRKNEAKANEMRGNLGGSASDLTDLQRSEDLLLVLERYADLAQCSEDEDIVCAALRLLRVA
jgi:hypothetical protein